jgi:hypothetical protein
VVAAPAGVVVAALAAIGLPLPLALAALVIEPDVTRMSVDPCRLPAR